MVFEAVLIDLYMTVVSYCFFKKAWTSLNFALPTDETENRRNNL